MRAPPAVPAFHPGGASSPDLPLRRCERSRLGLLLLLLLYGLPGFVPGVGIGWVLPPPPSAAPPATPTQGALSAWRLGADYAAPLGRRSPSVSAHRRPGRPFSGGFPPRGARCRAPARADELGWVPLPLRVRVVRPPVPGRADSPFALACRGSLPSRIGTRALVRILLGSKMPTLIRCFVPHTARSLNNWSTAHAPCPYQSTEPSLRPHSVLMQLPASPRIPA